MNQIRIVDHNPAWEAEFKEIALDLRTATGDSVVRIDHIGSTAVPMLAAKDVIDIQLSVSNLATSEVIELLEAVGYVDTPGVTDNLVGLPSDSKELAKRFMLQPEGQRRTHVHIREVGRLNQQYPLLFRDYLRSNGVVRDAYQLIKSELAQRFANDSESYYAIKDPYMDTVYEAAKLWAERTDWAPDSKFY